MPEALDLFAAELAFGLLDGSERLKALQLKLNDPAFAAAVRRWEAIAETWLAELPDHQPAPQVWDRVAALIAPSRGSAQRSRSADAPAVLADLHTIWRPLAIAASLPACLFAGLWLWHFDGSALPRSPAIAANPVGRFSVAQVRGAGEPHLATVLYDRDTGALTVRIAAIAADPSKAPEVWLINGSNPPHSLGFGQTGAVIRMQASARFQRSLVSGATLAITLEPIADHPHAAPSSRILGTGTISTL